jgi:hypothetical protein
MIIKTVIFGKFSISKIKNPMELLQTSMMMPVGNMTKMPNSNIQNSITDGAK